MDELPSTPLAPPQILAVYHVGPDESTRQLSGSMALDIRFPIGSVTKTLTALLAARLVLDGVLSWDEPLATSRDVRRPVSLRTVLCHTAALPFELHSEHWVAAPLTGSELTSAVVAPPRLQLPPGTWHYSNLGYALAARLLENATGQTFPALLSEHLLRPLGMTTTSFPDSQTEGTLVLGAAAPAGDLWSTLDDLMTLARAIDGRRPDVITGPMLALLLEAPIADGGGAYFGAGIRTHRVRHHRVLVSTGTIVNRTTCITVWPRRGASVMVAEAGYSHDELWRAATRQWRRDDTPVRTWWWDGQAVIELRHRDEIELVLHETTWPFPLFSGHAQGNTLIGVDWSGQPRELLDRGDALVATGLRLTADVADSAYEPAVPS